MYKKYSETISDLEKKIKQLSENGIEIQPLNTSINELKKHIENVEKIEENIDAIREEVIDKIKTELEYNKKAGAFSIYGFWVGSVALVMSIASIGMTLFDEPNSVVFSSKKDNISNSGDSLTAKINNIDYKLDELIFNTIGFSNKHKVDSTQFLLNVYYDGREKATVISDSLTEIKIAALDVEEKEEGDSLVYSATVCFYANGNKIGKKGISEIYRVKNSEFWTYDNYNGGVIIKENDTIQLFLDYFVVQRIYITESKSRRIADSKNAVLLKKITSTSYKKKKE